MRENKKKKKEKLLAWKVVEITGKQEKYELKS